MFPANIIATNGSFRQKANVSSNLENDLNKGFQMYNVYNPSYWQYRERMVYGEQNRNVSNVANYSASSSTDSNALKPKRSRAKGSATKPKKVIEKKANNKKVFREKSAFSYSDLIKLGLLNSRSERANCKTLYNFIGYHFPSIQSLPHAKNSIRHALTDDKGRFERVPNTGKSMGRDSAWTFGVNSREQMIYSVIEKITENENTMENLMMRNLGGLHGILAGNCPVPEDFVMESHILNVSSEQDSSFSTNQINRSRVRYVVTICPMIGSIMNLRPRWISDIETSHILHCMTMTIVNKVFPSACRTTKTCRLLNFIC